MNNTPTRLISTLFSFNSLIVLTSAAWLVSCDFEDDDVDHDPPPGLGSIVIQNNTYNDISVFINGTVTNDVDSYEADYYDLTPGVYRLVLDEQNGDHSYAGDVDVLQDQRTTLDVTIDPGDPDDFDIFMNFD